MGGGGNDTIQGGGGDEFDQHFSDPVGADRERSLAGHADGLCFGGRSEVRNGREAAEHGQQKKHDENQTITY